jgi:hypothetical protein
VTPKFALSGESWRGRPILYLAVLTISPMRNPTRRAAVANITVNISVGIPIRLQDDAQ